MEEPACFGGEERKGEAWSKDPFTKRSSLKLPYKPENLGSDLMVAPKGGDDEDAMIVSEVVAAAPSERAKEILIESSPEGPAEEGQKAPSQ